MDIFVLIGVVFCALSSFILLLIAIAAYLSYSRKKVKGILFYTIIIFLIAALLTEFLSIFISAPDIYHHENLFPILLPISLIINLVIMRKVVSSLRYQRFLFKIFSNLEIIFITIGVLAEVLLIFHR